MKESEFSTEQINDWRAFEKVRSGGQSFASFWWFRIAKDGEENRNTNSHIA